MRNAQLLCQTAQIGGFHAVPADFQFEERIFFQRFRKGRQQEVMPLQMAQMRKGTEGVVLVYFIGKREIQC